MATPHFQNVTLTKIIRFLQKSKEPASTRSISSGTDLPEKDVSHTLSRLEKDHLVGLSGFDLYKLTETGKAWPKQVRAGNVAPPKTISKMDTHYVPPTTSHYRAGSDQAEKVRSRGF